MGGLVRPLHYTYCLYKRLMGIASPLLLRIVQESFEGGIQTLWDKEEDYRENWGYLVDSLTTSCSVRMGKGLLLGFLGWLGLLYHIMTSCGFQGGLK